MASPRVVTCGEALVDLIASDSDARTWRASPGGAPFNAAVAAGRLGAPTTFLGVLSSDAFGELLRRHLVESKVVWSTCPITDEPTTLAVVTDGDGEDASFAFHVAGTTTVSTRVNDLHLPVDTGVFHASGSVAMVLEPAASRLEALLAAARHRSLVHLDPNPRPAIAGDREAYLRRLRRWLTLVDVVKVSAADVEWLYPGSDPVQVARGWLRDGDGVDAPIAVVVTRGADGAVAVLPGGSVEVAAEPVRVVDTVGAGDAFAGALLAAFASHQVTGRAAAVELETSWWRTALTYAVEAAGIACTRVGADPPWRRQLH